MAGQMTANEMLAVLSMALERGRLARAMGAQYDGKRDLYAVLGYPTAISFQQYLEKYKRQDVAGKVVDLPARDTWRRPPVIADDGGDTAQDAPASEFIQGVRALVERRRLWHYLQRVDRLAGVGRFGVLLLGARPRAAGERLDEPLVDGSLRTPLDVLYLAPYAEGSVLVSEFERRTDSERFGLPVFYTIQLGEQLGSERVHWSRVLHVAEDLDEDEVYGRPRLERVYNRLEDLLKIAGGGSEATWRVMDRGLHADARDGFAMEDGEAAQALSDEIEEYVHGLRRVIRTQGVDIQPLGSEVVDPSGLFGILMGLIAAACDIPQRILLGSERGELASSQDLATWAGFVAARQTQFAEPVILRPFLDRMIRAGALAEPVGGRYHVRWQSLFELSEKERVDMANTVATAAARMSPGSPELVVTIEEFRERVLQWPRTPAGGDERLLLDEEDEGGEGAV